MALILFSELSLLSCIEQYRAYWAEVSFGRFRSLLYYARLYREMKFGKYSLVTCRWIGVGITFTVCAVVVTFHFFPCMWSVYVGIYRLGCAFAACDYRCTMYLGLRRSITIIALSLKQALRSKWVVVPQPLVLISQCSRTRRDLMCVCVCVEWHCYI